MAPEYYYRLENKRYVSSKDNLHKCNNTKLLLKRVNAYDELLGISEIIIAKDLLKESNNCTTCLKENNNKPICSWKDTAGTCLPNMSEKDCLPDRATWCVPPTPAPPTPAPTPMPPCSQLKSSSKCCERACTKCPFDNEINLFECSDCSKNDPIPSPAPPPPPGTVTKNCIWKENTCQNFTGKCTIPELPDKLLVGYIGASTAGNTIEEYKKNIMMSSHEAINQGINILVLCFFAPNDNGRLIISFDDGIKTVGDDKGETWRNAFLDLIKQLQKYRPKNGKPKRGEALLWISLGGARPYKGKIENLPDDVITNIANDFIENFDGVDGIDFDYEMTFDTPTLYRGLFKVANIIKKAKGTLFSAAPEGVCFQPGIQCMCGCGAWTALKENPVLDIVWPQIYDGTDNGRCDSLAHNSKGLPSEIEQQTTIMETANPHLKNKIVLGLPIGGWWKNYGNCALFELFARWPNPNPILDIMQEDYLNDLANLSNTRGIMFWNIEWALAKGISPSDAKWTGSGTYGVDSGFIKACAKALGL
tara:strand:+ start:2294 stop:3892 length:1599 start_codon:yes stop_codon:yes gene_type:complete